MTTHALGAGTKTTGVVPLESADTVTVTDAFAFLRVRIADPGNPSESGKTMGGLHFRVNSGPPIAVRGGNGSEAVLPYPSTGAASITLTADVTVSSVWQEKVNSGQWTGPAVWYRLDVSTDGSTWPPP